MGRSWIPVYTTQTETEWCKQCLFSQQPKLFRTIRDAQKWQALQKQSCATPHCARSHYECIVTEQIQKLNIRTPHISTCHHNPTQGLPFSLHTPQHLPLATIFLPLSIPSKHTRTLWYLSIHVYVHVWEGCYAQMEHKWIHQHWQWNNDDISRSPLHPPFLPISSSPSHLVNKACWLGRLLKFTKYCQRFPPGAQKSFYHISHLRDRSDWGQQSHTVYKHIVRGAVSCTWWQAGACMVHSDQVVWWCVVWLCDVVW